MSKLVADDQIESKKAVSGCHSKLGGTADTYSSLSWLWQGFSITFKEPRPKVAGEFRDIDADGAKARSTFLSEEG